MSRAGPLRIAVGALVAATVLAITVAFAAKRGDERPAPPSTPSASTSTSTSQAAASTDAGSASSGDRAVIFLSSDMRGYLAPCGCSENMRGGIARVAHQLQEAKQDGTVLYFDAGDSLFPKQKLSPEEVPQQERKAKALAEAFKRMGLTARTSGERDDARGVTFRKQLGLPELAPGEAKVVPVGDDKVAAIAGADAKSLIAAAKKARAEGAEFVVALFHGTVAQAQQLAKDAALEAHLIVASHAETELAGEENKLLRTRIPIVQLQNKGRSVARVEVSFAPTDGPFELLTTQADVERELSGMEERIDLLNKQINAPGLGAEARKLRQDKIAELIERREAIAEQKAPSAEGKNAYSIRFVPLEATLPSAPEIKAVLVEYDRDVGELNLAYAKKFGRDCPKPKKGQPAFVGNANCKECHEEAFPVWEASKHAHGYETLQTAGKQYHLDCIGCHVTGWQEPGGVCRLDKVAGREGVGCESCHGPGSLHAEDPSDTNISRGNTEQACIGCHDKENSPHFDFAAYLPQILGKGHGEKAAKSE